VRRLLTFILLLAGMAGAPGRVALASGELLAAAARQAITPQHSVWMAGYGLGPVRRSRGTEGELYARALALSRDDRTLVLVSVDLIGLWREDVEAIRRLVGRQWTQDAPPAVIVACTHTHSGPDTLGLWGGVSRAWRQALRENIARAVLSALEAREPVEVAAVTVPVAGRNRNRRHPAGSTWDEISALRFFGRQGQTVATVIGYAAHPTILGADNQLLNADFPGYLAGRVERNSGGVCLYLTGAAGDQSPARVEGKRAEAARHYGETIADLVEAALSTSAGGDPAPILDYRWGTVEVPLANWRLAVGSQLGVIARQARGGVLETEVWVVRLGSSYLFTLPGEPLVAVGLGLREAWAAHGDGTGAFFVVSSAQDALGYLVPAADWKDTGYEESLAISRPAADLLVDLALGLAAELDGREVPSPSTAPDELARARTAAWRLAIGIRLGVIGLLFVLLAAFAAVAWTTWLDRP